MSVDISASFLFERGLVSLDDIGYIFIHIIVSNIKRLVYTVILFDSCMFIESIFSEM